MFSRVLVPLDGSPLDASALSSASAIARVFDARVRLLRVARAPVGSTRSYSLADEYRDAERYLNGVAREIAASGLKVSTHVRSGDVPGAILYEIGEHLADLVILATRGESGWLHGEHGSITREVLSWTPVPVIIQRAGARPLSGIRTVLVPLDGGPVSLLALGAAIDLAHATGAHITLLRVVEPMPSSMHDTAAGFHFADRMDPSWDTAALAGAKRHLEELMEQLREGGVSAQGEAILGDVPSTIAEHAEKINADIIVMSTRASHGVARVLSSSTADAVVHHARVPVLLIRSNETCLSEPVAPDADDTDRAHQRGGCRSPDSAVECRSSFPRTDLRPGNVIREQRDGEETSKAGAGQRSRSKQASEQRGQ
jgi:nucleotide-binding universal stress UspA family protein